MSPEVPKGHGKAHSSTDINNISASSTSVRVSQSSTTADRPQVNAKQLLMERTRKSAFRPAQKNSENNNNDILKAPDSRKPVNGTTDRDSDKESVYEQFDIVGDTHNVRFPWQHDVTTQCDGVLRLDSGVQTDQVDLCDRCSVDKAAPRLDHSPSLLHRVLRGSPNNIRRKGKLVKQASLDCMLPSRDSLGGSFTPPRPRSKSALPTSNPLAESELLASVNSELSHNVVGGITNSKLSATPLQLPLTTSDHERYNDRSSYPPSPLSSPPNSPYLPKKDFERKLSGGGRPKVVVSHHREDSDSASGVNACSLLGSTESLTSESSSLRVPSPDFLQTKATYSRERTTSASSDLDDPPPTRPASHRIRQRRGAVISQASQAASADNDQQVEDDTVNNDTFEPAHRQHGGLPPLPRSGSNPGQLDLLFPPGMHGGGGSAHEHRASIMSEASTTLASVAAVHLQDFIEASAQGLDSAGTGAEDGHDNKKTIAAIFRKKFGKQDKVGTEGITSLISNFKIHDQDDLEFAVFKDKHWTDLLESKAEQLSGKNGGHVTMVTKEETKRRDKIWEVFRSECVFLVDHILLLKEIFQERLRWLQCEGHLMHIEVVKLFANVDELCSVSANICRDLIKNFSSKLTSQEFAQTDTIVLAFQNFATHVCPAYIRYCMNYSSALHYLETLRKQDDFIEFCKLCEQDKRCKRLQLTDLLVTPIQRITKYTLLLRDIRDCTKDPSEKTAISTTLKAVENAIGDVEGKVKWLANFERLRELQQMITWPNVEELDSKIVVPEFLRTTVSKKTKANLLMSTKRTLVHEGPLLMYEHGKLSDVYALLFDDMLLITKRRRVSATKKRSIPDSPVSLTPQYQGSLPQLKDGACLIVDRLPIPLDRLELLDVDAKQAAASGLKHCFVLLHISRYGQVIGVHTFACNTENVQQTWLSQFRESKGKWVQVMRDEHSATRKDERRRSESCKKKSL